MKTVNAAGSSAEADALADQPSRTWRIWGVDFDARIVQIVSVATVILIIAFNNRFVEAEYDRFVLEFIIPVAIILLVWREDPRRYGLRLGDWRLGLVVVVLGVAGLAVVIWFLGRLPDFRAYYTDTIAGRPTWRLIIDTGVDLLAWEFFFRGWLMWALARKYGTDAIWLQVIPFALMHVWKPEIEQLSTLVGGAFFGLLAWRTKSFVWGWLLHWFMMAWVLVVTAGFV
ncbi:MAG: CPBP family intramembrane glutamic endopeptidase [Candidatus Limnocylindrales bacterium]|jgi:membrane protease YdiL (CAAX protease family)